MIANILQTNTRNTEKRERIHCKFPGYVHDTLVLIQPFLFFTHAPFLISERKTKSKKFSYIYRYSSGNDHSEFNDKIRTKKRRFTRNNKGYSIKRETNIHNEIITQNFKLSFPTFHGVQKVFHSMFVKS